MRGQGGGGGTSPNPAPNPTLNPSKPQPLTLTQEAVWGTPVVDQSPLFFGTPFWHLLQEIF